MPVHNSEITTMLNELADLLEIDQANSFRVRAYREAARTVKGLSRSVAEMVDSGEQLNVLPGIGGSIAEKIKEIVRTGHLDQLESQRETTPTALSELMTLPGLGPKRIKMLHDKLGIEDRESLARAAREHKIRALEGLGAKTEQRILQELSKRQDGDKRHRRIEIEEIAQSFLKYLRDLDGVKQAVIAGSYRRRKETVRDLDILVTSKRDSNVMDRFVEYEDVAEVISKGKTRSTVRLRSDLQVDLRVVAEVCYGAALHYFTGSKAHNIAVRKIGVGNGLKINEYGVFRDDERIAGQTEEEVFEQVGLPYIEPELREDQGEIDAAKQGDLPTLVTCDDLRGDLHCHTKASDGKNTLEEMADAATARGYDYLAITEHSKRLTVARGLDEDQLRHQIDQIDQLNETLAPFRLLKSTECDINEDGSLDLDDAVLARLDLVVGAVHSKFDLPEDKQTERVIRAMDNPFFNILAHPMGRIFGQREPIQLDLERVMYAAKERGCFLEINSQPDRLDLSGAHARMAKKLGVKLAISTDSHSIATLAYIRHGVDQARRGSIESDDVINTRNWRDLKQLLKRS